MLSILFSACSISQKLPDPIELTKPINQKEVSGKLEPIEELENIDSINNDLNEIENDIQL